MLFKPFKQGKMFFIKFYITTIHCFILNNLAELYFYAKHFIANQFHDCGSTLISHVWS